MVAAVHDGLSRKGPVAPLDAGGRTSGPRSPPSVPPVTTGTSLGVKRIDDCSPHLRTGRRGVTPTSLVCCT